MNQSLVPSVARASGANRYKALIRRAKKCDSCLGEQRDYRITCEAAGGAEGEGGEPMDAEPSGGEDEGVADDWKEGEEGDRGAVAAHPGEGTRIGRALRDQAADEVGGHAAGGVGDGGDCDCEGGVPGPQVQVGKQRAFGGKRQQGRGEKAGRGEAEEFRHAKFAASRGRW